MLVFASYLLKCLVGLFLWVDYVQVLLSFLVCSSQKIGQKLIIHVTGSKCEFAPGLPLGISSPTLTLQQLFAMFARSLEHPSTMLQPKFWQRKQLPLRTSYIHCEVYNLLLGRSLPEES